MCASAVPAAGTPSRDDDRWARGAEVRPNVCPQLGVHSEAGVLRTALLDVGCRGRLIGDRAAVAVAEVLQSRGIGVVALRDLLADLLSAAEARRVLVERIVDVAALPPFAADRLERILREAEPTAAVKMLLDGLPVRDFDADRVASPRSHFLLQPLPRSRSLRSSWIVVGSTMLPALPSAAHPAGRRAVAIATALCRLHPALRALRPTRYVHDPSGRRSDAQVDGDDVQIAPDGSLLIGIGHRTTAHGARQLARTVLDAGLVRRVTVVALPLGPRFDRLDDLLVPVDRDLTLVHPAALFDAVLTWTLRGGTDGGPMLATAARPFRTTMVGLLNGGRMLTVPDDGAVSAGPEHFVPLEPGALLTGASATDPTVRLLERFGVEVLSVPDGNGPAGGVRRLAQPLLRDAVPTD